MSPEIEKKVATLEGRMDSMKENHAELKEVLLEIRKETKELPELIGRQVRRSIRRSIRRCRANPPELSMAEKRDEATKENDIFDLTKTWNKALVTLVLIITTVITLWANQWIGAAKESQPPAKAEQESQK